MDARDSSGNPVALILDAYGKFQARRAGVLSNTDIDALEDVAIIDVSNCNVLYLQFTIATAVLTAFSVQYRIHASGTYFVVASAAADFTTPNAPVLKASDDLENASVASHWLKLDVAGVESVKIRAAGTSSVLAGYWSAQ